MSKQTTLNILKTILYQIEDVPSTETNEEERKGAEKEVQELKQAIKWVRKQ